MALVTKEIANWKQIGKNLGDRCQNRVWKNIFTNWKMNFDSCSHLKKISEISFQGISSEDSQEFINEIKENYSQQ